MPGTNDGPIMGGKWGFTIVSKTGRIYFFCNVSTGCWSASYTTDGVMRCCYSDDDGYTWQIAWDRPVGRREKFDHSAANVPVGWIVWQPAIRDGKGHWITGFTRWSSLDKYPKPHVGYHPDSRSELMRFDNIDDGPDPKDIKITWLPETDDTVSVPCPIEPEKSKGYSLAEEPAIVLLPDGRLFMIVRTITGHIWYSVSDDDGANWRPSEILRYTDDGAEVLHPKSPMPMYRMDNGKYVLFFHNHDGTGYGAMSPRDMAARRPIFMTVGEFRPKAHQPIWFSEPEFQFDTDGVACGPGGAGVEGGRDWLAMYGCLTEHKGQRVFWYPDRKHFLLGRHITDEMVDSMIVPE